MGIKEIQLKKAILEKDIEGLLTTFEIGNRITYPLTRLYQLEAARVNVQGCS